MTRLTDKQEAVLDSLHHAGIWRYDAPGYGGTENRASTVLVLRALVRKTLAVESSEIPLTFSPII